MTEIIIRFFLPLASAIVALLYWRRASLGLEKHLTRVSLGFSILAVYEMLNMGDLFRTTKLVIWYKIVAPFGVLEMSSYFVLFVAGFLLLRWTWYYLLKRLSTQLFMIAVSGAVALLVITSSLFVMLLLKSVTEESLSKLKSNGLVTSVMLIEKQAKIMSETKLFAQALDGKDVKELKSIVEKQVKNTGVSQIVILDLEGKVVLKGGESEDRGVSWVNDPYLIRAQKGESVGGFVTSGGVLAPIVMSKVVVPSKEWIVMSFIVFDNAFMDGLKQNTGLSVTIYGDKRISATSEISSDGKSRLIGVEETDQEVLDKVWQTGEVVAKPNAIGDREYLSAFVPLKDVNNEVVAAMQVSQTQEIALRGATEAIVMTFGLVVMLMIGLSLPIYWICQRLVAEWS